MEKKLNWINPHRRSRPLKRCEYCGKDVETPYKGVHDEVELILGIPQPCRNNGKLNGHIAHGYFEGTRKPVDGVKWFVEHPETHQWWTGYKWTSDPYEAFGCELEYVADRYARFQKIENYIITEHMFVDDKKEGIETEN